MIPSPLPCPLPALWLQNASGTLRPFTSCGNTAAFVNSSTGALAVVCGFKNVSGSAFLAPAWNEPLVEMPFTVHYPPLAVNGTPVEWLTEDPEIYQDIRGNWHMLTHNIQPCRLGTATPFTDGSNTGGGCGGHAFSRDGANWTYSPVVAYNSSGEAAALRGGTRGSRAAAASPSSSSASRSPPAVVWADGRVVDYGRERPKMLLDGFGNPWVLYNGMADHCCGNVGPRGDDHTWTGAVPLPLPPSSDEAGRSGEARVKRAAQREARRNGPGCAWAR